MLVGVHKYIILLHTVVLFFSLYLLLYYRSGLGTCYVYTIHPLVRGTKKESTPLEVGWPTSHNSPGPEAVSRARGVEKPSARKRSHTFVQYCTGHPRYGPKRYSRLVTAQIVGYGYPKSVCTSLESSCCRLGAVQVMTLGAKFGRPGPVGL